jgi:hypothetical protein
MRQLTQREFRWLVLIGGFLWIVAMLGQWLAEPFASEDVRTILQWNSYEALAPLRLLHAIFWYSNIAFVAGLIGFALFKAWGRSLLLFSFALGSLATFISGVLVFPPIVTGLLVVAGDLVLVLLTLSYFPPHSDYFEYRKKRPTERGQSIEFEPFNADESEQSWVTLTRCRTLTEADGLATRLRGANIPVFIPDEISVQTLITTPSVRVQVPPSQYHTAREILAA